MNSIETLLWLIFILPVIFAAVWIWGEGKLKVLIATAISKATRLTAMGRVANLTECLQVNRYERPLVL